MKFFMFFLRRGCLALWLAIMAVTLSSPVVLSAHASEDFQNWLEEYKIWAKGQGIRQETLDIAFADIRAPRQGSLKADAKQAEFILSFSDYYGRTVSVERLRRARRLGEQHKDLLAEVYAKYKVPPSYLLAFWGLESNFGDYTGKVPVIHTLATLAFDLRRRAFFEKELLQALKIIQSGDIAPADMRGSWAGAMGQTQFMPSTFTAYAIDGNRDGKRDLWNNLADIFHSSANFLANIGWRADEAWGYRVSLPTGFDYGLSGIKKLKPVSFWKKQGVRLADGSALPTLKGKASLIVPSGHDGAAFLVLENFRVIMRWNNSVLYALSVGLLAQQIAADADHPVKVPVAESLATAVIKRMQAKLNRLGYDAGGADGILGNNTKAALQKYQKDKGLPNDGYPSRQTLQSLDLL